MKTVIVDGSRRIESGRLGHIERVAAPSLFLTFSSSTRMSADGRVQSPIS